MAGKRRMDADERNAQRINWMQGAVQVWSREFEDMTEALLAFRNHDYPPGWILTWENL